ncbi:putative membrane protein [Plasmodium gaboni]|uniref:Putative membrane protein n=1 Tax=Plasmodium gaboni TaxID=647221 RepID=A0A151LQ56_9APIC|nr:putative membrane protein [Plasmodium gaboni]KYO01325.1 putative membrane protein [Plasmodium gaboni]
MFYHLKNRRNFLNNFVHKNVLVEKGFNIRYYHLNRSPEQKNDYNFLKTCKFDLFRNDMIYQKKNITYCTNHKGQYNEFVKEKNNHYEKKEKVSDVLSYPESKSFPYASISIIIGMIGISGLLKYLIYNLKNCDNEKSIRLEVDKIISYLDKYFILHNNEKTKGMHINNKIFNIKYITCAFFINENTLQCSIQLCTFFLSSCFLEKYYGPLKYISLFLCGTIFSNFISLQFFKFLKEVESLRMVDFVLIHPSGSMAFICALCSLYFKKWAIWKNIPIHCSVLMVPYLISSFYGISSLYKIKKHNVINSNKVTNNELNNYKNEMLQNGKDLLNHKSDYNNIINNINDNINIHNNTQDINKNTMNIKECRIIDTNNHTLNTLKNYLIINACDSVIQKRKRDNIFFNKKLQNLKKEAQEHINEINDKSQKMFFALSSAFTDMYGILLATAACCFMKCVKYIK